MKEKNNKKQNFLILMIIMEKKEIIYLFIYWLLNLIMYELNSSESKRLLTIEKLK